MLINKCKHKQTLSFCNIKCPHKIIRPENDKGIFTCWNCGFSNNRQRNAYWECRKCGCKRLEAEKITSNSKICLNCKEVFTGNQRKFCCVSCRAKYYYKNDKRSLKNGARRR